MSNTLRYVLFFLFFLELFLAILAIYPLLFLNTAFSGKASSCSCVTSGRLTSARKMHFMSGTTITVNFHKPFNVKSCLFSEITLNSEVIFDEFSDSRNILLSKITNPLREVHAYFSKNYLCCLASNTIDVSKANLDFFCCCVCLHQRYVPQKSLL